MIFKKSTQLNRNQYKQHLIEIDAWEDQDLKKIPKRVREEQADLGEWMR